MPVQPDTVQRLGEQLLKDRGYTDADCQIRDPEQQETYAPSTGRNVITGEDFESLLEGWMKEAEVVVKEDLVKKITFENMYQTVDPSFTPPSLTQESSSSAADNASSENS